MVNLVSDSNIEFKNRINKIKSEISSLFIDKNVYVYGTGTFGKMFWNFLIKNGFVPNGFVTTQGGEILYEKTVYPAEMIVHDNNNAVILAVNENIQNEIRNTVEFECPVYSISNLDYAYLETGTFMIDSNFSEKKSDFDRHFENENINTILIVQLEVTYGDMVWSTAFLRELRLNYPDAKIDYVMNSKFSSLYKECRYIDKIYGYDCSSLNELLSEQMVNKVRKFVKESGISQYDIVFQPRLLPLTFSDAWENVILAQECGGRYRIAHSLYFTYEQKFRTELLSDVYTLISKHEKAQHEVANDLELLKIIGKNTSSIQMELWGSEDDESFAKHVLNGSAYYVAVGVVGSTKTRSWPAEKYAELFKRIGSKYGNRLKFVLCGGDDALVEAEKILSVSPDNCVNLIGKTSLRQVAATIKNCEMYLGSDTGLMHMASSFGKKIIEISASIGDAPDYWGSSPVRTGPWQVDAIILRPSKGLDDCKYMCHRRYAHCINQISVETVYDAVLKMMEDES